MLVKSDAYSVLEKTSRTFFIPIMQLPGELRDSVAASYLCMRAIDEIEDHPAWDPTRRAELLRALSETMQTPFEPSDITALLEPFASELDEVVLRLAEWLTLAPQNIAPRIWDATAAMADRMASWAENDFTIHTKADLDRYTYSVAGAVGLLLADLWNWHVGVVTQRPGSVAFGRGLQAVNILRNRREDLERGADFFPAGWKTTDMHRYAARNLAQADLYIQDIPRGPIHNFCAIPLTLARNTLSALADGRPGLTRSDVIGIVAALAQSQPPGIRHG
ncbi:squalene/phytoene synthase family protein [Streptomyces sp. NPDC056069]|uniref:squalene/phytoene synthase family protein n=1 Tax=Streptomyces sp. NPDC056069 TaxID=3345702 RepID=UPI0035DFA5ED